MKKVTFLKSHLVMVALLDPRRAKVVAWASVRLSSVRKTHFVRKSQAD